MEYDDERLLNEIAEIKRDLTSVKTDVAFIKGQMSSVPGKNGAPISASPQGLSLTDIATSKYGIFMGVSAVISALGAVLANFMGK